MTAPGRPSGPQYSAHALLPEPLLDSNTEGPQFASDTLVRLYGPPGLGPRLLVDAAATTPIAASGAADRRGMPVASAARWASMPVR